MLCNDLTQPVSWSWSCTNCVSDDILGGTRLRVPASHHEGGISMRKTLGLAAALVLGLLPTTAFTQAAGGNVYGTVADDSGAALAGATVEVSSSRFGNRSTTSDTQGAFRFLSLDPGTYTLTVTLSGFATTKRDVVINLGANVNLGFTMKIAGVTESVTVTEATPTVDIKKVGTATLLSKEELSQVPQGRDPWAVLNSVPGVTVYRVSVAGSEAGQQSSFAGKGATPFDTMWSYDGVPITDTTSYGASSSYFDFDAFDEINVTTGGGDLKVQSGGLGLNFAIKRGTNAFHGAARGYFSFNDLQSTNTPTELEGDPRLFDGKADHIDKISDYGFDLGGPILKDKLWFWASYGRNDIRLYRLTTASSDPTIPNVPANDKTILNNWNAKVNWQASSSDQVSFLFFNGAKEKFGRSPGQAGHEADSFTWNQGNFYPEQDCGLPCAMHGLWKLEWNHTFSPNFVLDAKYAYYNWGYGFDPRGGPDQSASIDKFNDSAKGSWYAQRFLKPWHNVLLDGNYFTGKHELKFGFGYRHWPNTSSTFYSGTGVVSIINSDNPADDVALVERQSVVGTTSNYTNFYLGDTYTMSRLTINAGIRYDHQIAHMDPSVSQANPLLPEVVPSVAFDGNVPGITWNDVSPRIGVTYALDENHKTIARGSYARYAGQLSPIDAQFNSPVTYNYNYLAYAWADRNGDGFAQRDEILVDQGVLYSSGIDPSNPGGLSTPHRLDPDYHANHDNEIVAGIEREIAPNFALGAAYTWRKTSGIVDWGPRIDSSGRILTSADYLPLDPVSANGFTVQPFAPDDSKIGAGGRLLTNRPDYTTSYSGIELTANKRLADKWMFRGNVSYGDWTEHLDGPAAIQNPTKADRNLLTQGGFYGSYSIAAACAGCVDGGPVVLKSYGAKTNVFFHSKWQFSANAMYQLPAGFEIAANLLGHQGYPKAIEIRTGLGSDGRQRVLPSGGFDVERHKDFYNLDLRLAKKTKLGGSVTLGINLDLFNVFNNGVILQDQRQANTSDFGTPEGILEIMNPRILRLGARLEF